MVVNRAEGTIEHKTFENFLDYFEFVKDRPGHDLRYALNSKTFYDNTKFKSITDKGNSAILELGIDENYIMIIFKRFFY